MIFELIQGLCFNCTCGVCPEQYEVLKDDEEVGYVRLRFGHLAAYAFTCGSYEDARLGEGNKPKIVFESNDFDGMQGCFPTIRERDEYLDKIASAINKYLEEQKDEAT